MLSQSYATAITEGSLVNIADFVYSGSGRDQGGTIPIVLGVAASYIGTHRQAVRFARELPKNRRRTEVSVPYCGSLVPSAGTLKL
jgi:hypothetical protein